VLLITGKNESQMAGNDFCGTAQMPGKCPELQEQTVSGEKTRFARLPSRGPARQIACLRD
jgi:hypothetical protein